VARDQYNINLDRKMEQFEKDKEELLAKAAEQVEKAVLEERRANEDKVGIIMSVQRKAFLIV